MGLAPLQLLIFRYETEKNTLPYEDAIVQAFQGGKDARTYVPAGEDLGIDVKPFTGVPKYTVPELLDCTCHTLIILLVGQGFLEKGDDSVWDWLLECWRHVRASNKRHAMMPVVLNDEVGREIARKRKEFGDVQVLDAATLGEFSIRPAMLALRLLHESRRLLARAIPSLGNDAQSGFLRLFISHAKLDGLPLAHALMGQIRALKWLEKFYDAEDLPAGCDWQEELKRGVGSSLIVILRTEIYDTRPWCQQEVYWADEFATPAVLVDARTNLNHPAGFLPLDRIPTVRIPDGNLIRVLFVALREGLRFLHFMRRVEQMKAEGMISEPFKAFSFPPSMAALLRASEALKARGSSGRQAVILYADPPLRSGLYEAASALIEKYAPNVVLTTPLTLAASKGSIV